MDVGGQEASSLHEDPSAQAVLFRWEGAWSAVQQSPDPLPYSTFHECMNDLECSHLSLIEEPFIPCCMSHVHVYMYITYYLPPSLPPLPLQPPAVEDEKELEDLKDGAQLRLMLWLEMEKEKSNFAEEIKLIGGEIAVYAETVSGRNHYICM